MFFSLQIVSGTRVAQLVR